MSDKSMAATNGTGCGKCGCPLVADEHVRLWDGHNYCLDCVSAHSERLAAFAKCNTTFVDVVQLTEVISVPRFAASLMIFVAILLVPILAFLPNIFGQLLALSLILVVTYTGVYTVGNVMKYPQTITVANGVVHVRTPIGSIRHALSECRWSFDHWFERSALIIPIPPRIRIRSVLLHIRRPFNDAQFIMCVETTRYELLADFLAFVQADG
jgi:hypothetical protein